MENPGAACLIDDTTMIFQSQAAFILQPERSHPHVDEAPLPAARPKPTQLTRPLINRYVGNVGILQVVGATRPRSIILPFLFLLFHHRMSAFIKEGEKISTRRHHSVAISFYSHSPINEGTICLRKNVVNSVTLAQSKSKEKQLLKLTLIFRPFACMDNTVSFIVGKFIIIFHKFISHWPGSHAIIDNIRTRVYRSVGRRWAYA